MKRLTCVDLFSGAGGLSKGFLDAGYDVVLGVDFDDAALRTFKANHGSAEAMKLDLFNHDNINVIVEFLRERDIKLDVLVGGPPCQGFSIAGPRDMNDKRNSLYSAMVKLANTLKPRAVILENVPGMIQTNDGIGAKRIIEDCLNVINEKSNFLVAAKSKDSIYLKTPLTGVNRDYDGKVVWLKDAVLDYKCSKFVGGV